MDLESYFPHVDEAASCLRASVDIVPRIIIVLSGGLGAFIEGLADPKDFSSKDLPHFPTARAEGHSGRLIFGSYKGVPLVALVGRYHYYEGHAPQQIVFPYFVLAKLGAKVLITTNAVGCVNRSFKPGDIMLVTDHINMMGINPLIGISVQRPQDQFPNMTRAYDPPLQKVAIAVAHRLKIDLKRGVYAATAGPSYETPAETAYLRKLGADAVGMSTVPEVIAASFLGLRVLSFSCVANPAADLHKGEMNHEEVLEAMNAMAPKVVELLRGVVEKIRE